MKGVHKMWSRIRACVDSILMLALLALALLHSGWGAPQPVGGDWPQWRGPDRTGLSAETGLLKSWPAEGPRLLWKAEALGTGYSTPSISRGRIYGMSYRGEDEFVWAIEAAGGKALWATRIAAAN